MSSVTQPISPASCQRSYRVCVVGLFPRDSGSAPSLLPCGRMHRVTMTSQGSATSLHSLFLHREEWAALNRRPKKNLTNWRENFFYFSLFMVLICGVADRGRLPPHVSNPTAPHHDVQFSVPAPTSPLKVHLPGGLELRVRSWIFLAALDKHARSRVGGTHSCDSCRCDWEDGWMDGWCRRNTNPFEIFKYQLICNIVGV